MNNINNFISFPFEIFLKLKQWPMGTYFNSKPAFNKQILRKWRGLPKLQHFLLIFGLPCIVSLVNPNQIDRYALKSSYLKNMFLDKISNKRPISLIFLLKTGALCWEADGNGTKLRNLFLNFKTPKLRSGACD